METADVVYGQGFKTSLKGEGLSAGQTDCVKFKNRV